MYFNRRFGQGVWHNFGLEVPLDVCYHLLHPVEVLTCHAAGRTSGSSRSWVRLNAGHDEKHLDDARDNKLQLEEAAPITHS